MNADALRHFYDYHFAQNRELWDRYVLQLSDEQFTQPIGYSHGSVRDQMVHLMDVDEVWFRDLSGSQIEEQLDPADTSDRAKIRAHWDKVEGMMRDYLANLSAERLSSKPLQGEDKDLFVWQVLLHVVNHGTDHRAQVLRLLNDMGVETKYQDYVFYTYKNPQTL